MINENEIRKWWAVFRPDNQLTEVRILGNNKTFSGYYSDVESLVQGIRPYDGFGIYVTLNPVKQSVSGRAQNNQIIQKPKETTSDNDIDYRSAVLIDIDPIRPAGTNASDEEKERAFDKCKEVVRFLQKQGFYNPVIADSANGYHIVYKVYFANDAKTSELVKNFLNALDMMFSDTNDGGAKIDVSVFNASRIAKLIGTTSNKGASTKERPQRCSKFYWIPPEFKENDIAYFRKIADMLPQPEKPDKFNKYQPTKVNLREFIAKHGIEIAKESRFSGGTKFVLKECPFDHNHKAPDSALFELDNGAIGFRCLHASCANYHWRDFRLHYDPSAYDQSAREDFNWRRKYNAPVKQEEIKPTVEDERGQVWMTAGEFKYTELSQDDAIPIGIPEFDKKTLGLIKGEVTIVSGGSGAGKTTFVNHIILNAVQRKARVALWSGEMAGTRIVGWLDQMAAGKQNVKPIEGTVGLYTVKNKQIRERINEWLGDRLYIYNNNYGQKWSHLSADIRKVIEEHNINLVIVDNLMALELDAYTGEANDKQKCFINDLTDLAAQTSSHIILVCHPRKENVNQLIRKESIAGTSDLTNKAFNVILLHRTGKDFERRGKEFFGQMKVDELKQYDLVLELNKARTTGHQDLLIGLYYEPETRRLKSDIAENAIYGWDDAPTEIPLYDDLPPDDAPPTHYYEDF